MQVNGTTDRVLWTNDNGQHWIYASQIGTHTTGSGSFLFWAHGRTLYRVLPWPPPYKCVKILRGTQCGYRDSSGHIRAARRDTAALG